MKIADIIALAKSGYKVDEIKELMKLGEEEPKEPEEDPEEPKEEPKEHEEKDDTDYKKLYEESQNTIKKLQKQNVKKDIKGGTDEKTDTQIVEELVRSFME